MHCNRDAQRRLAQVLLEQVREKLLPYNELINTGRVPWLSPSDLKQRVLVKGKVHPVDSELRKRSNGTTSCVRGGGTSSFRRGSSWGSRAPFKNSSLLSPKMSKGSIQRFSMILLRPIASMKLGPTHTSTMTRPDPSPATEEVTQEHTFVLREIRGRASVADRESTAVDDLARARNKLYREKSSKNTTDDFYASQLCVRSLPVAAFLKDAPPKWPLPITSINEDRLLRELGLTHTQRNDIEGLSSVSVRGGRGLTEAQLSSRAIARLAADPPSQVGRMQQRTARWLVR
jgi:hypothetical protein